MWLLGFTAFSQLFLPSLIAHPVTTNSSDGITTRRPNKAPEFCFSGQFLDVESNECRPCPTGHFMPDLIHTQLRCYPCERVSDNSPEIVLAACTTTQATTIGCKDGFYLYLAAVSDKRLTRCQACTNCSQTKPSSFEIRPCAKSFDATCCSRPDMAAIKRDGESGYECGDTNFDKPLPTQIPPQSQHLERNRMKQSNDLGLSQISSYYIPKLEISTLTLVKAIDQGYAKCSLSVWLSLGLSSALNFVCIIFMIFSLCKQKCVKMTSTNPPTPLQEGIMRMNKDSGKPLLHSLNFGYEKT